MFAALNRALNSKGLFLGLSVCSLAAFGARYAITAAHAAPAVAGWEWQRHPRTIVYYAKEGVCGCTSVIPHVAEEAATAKSDLLVVTETPLDADVAASLKRLRVTAVVVTDSTVIEQISPQHKAALVKVRDGAIVGRVYGNNPPKEFYNE